MFACTHGGIYTTHVRDLTGGFIRSGNKGILEALEEAVTIAKEAEIPMQISHLLLKEPLRTEKPLVKETEDL